MFLLISQIFPNVFHSTGVSFNSSSMLFIFYTIILPKNITTLMFILIILDAT